MSQSTMRAHSQRGFSLIEMLTVVAILTIVMGAVFRQIINVQQRYRTEETKTDLTQESREFLDQMVRDIHQVGFPQARLYGPGAALASPTVNDQRVAAGIVSFNYNDLWFEGDINGDGQVEVVRYTLQAGSGGKCPCKISRSETTKLNATAPLSQTSTSYSTEINNVINSGGSGGSGTNGALGISGNTPTGATNESVYGGLEGPYVFRAYDASGNAVSLPLDVSTTAGATALGTIRSIKVTINVLAAQSASDLQTGSRSAVTMTARARLGNY